MALTIVKDQEPVTPIYKTTGLNYYGTRRYEVPVVTQSGDTIVTSYGDNGNVRKVRFNGNDREVISNGYYDLNTGSNPEYIEVELVNPDYVAKYDQQAVRNSSELDYESTREWLKRQLVKLRSRFGTILKCGGKIRKGDKGIKTNTPNDISNITDEQVANLMYDRSMLGGENTSLYLGTNHGDPHINLYGDSISTEDGSKWRVNYMSYPTGITAEAPVEFVRTARRYNNDDKLIGEEIRSFKYHYPAAANPGRESSPAENAAAENAGRYYFTETPYKGFNSAYNWFINRKMKQGGKISDLLNNQEFLTTLQKCGGKIKKGQEGIPEGIESREFPPTWNQGEIRQGFQKTRPEWLQKFGDWAAEKSGEYNNPKKVGPLSVIFGPVFDYVTGLSDPETGYAAILPAGKAVKVANAAKKAALKESAQLNKAIERAFQERGLRESMKKWDAEILTNADRSVIKNKVTPNWLDEFKVDNTSRINELDLNNLIKGSQEPSWLGGLMIGSGLGTVGGGMYLLNKEHQKKKADQKPKDATKKNEDKK